MVTPGARIPAAAETIGRPAGSRRVSAERDTKPDRPRARQNGRYFLRSL